ncbi:MAG: type 1 glutamine amidotransferase domain-containing protein [Rubrivivax sp.]|nr:type 1 glutamine amidotransferase domain-containing protein [Rubrivivax sp.]
MSALFAVARRCGLPALALLSATAMAPSASASESPKVLLVVSGEGRLDAAGKHERPGFEMEELAQAWLVLRANGLRVEVASPAGGAPVADRYDAADDSIRAFKADPQAVAALKATRRTQDVAPGEHAAILVIGGKGAMFDLPRDTALATLLGTHHARGGVLAAVCHGPAVFASVRLPDGQPLVAGRRVTGFTDEEETVFGKRWAQEYPFWIERRLREQGARWEEANLMMPKLVVDDRLITGQNPFSTAMAAEAVVRALGRVPVARTPFREEASMQLVQLWLAGEQVAVRALLQADAKRYKTDLIAMLGHYQHGAATDDAARRQAISVMELAAPHFAHPQFRVVLARAHAGQGDTARARALIAQVMAPGHNDDKARSEAGKLLATLPPG